MAEHKTVQSDEVVVIGASFAGLAFARAAPLRGLDVLVLERRSAPGARLHVLAIGVNDYGEQARHLRLDFADQDARDVASALVNTQGSLYADVLFQVLRDETANEAGILHAFRVLEERMQEDDVAVVLFSGHGAIVDEEFFLLTNGVDARTPAHVAATAVSAISTLPGGWLRPRAVPIAPGRVAG